MENKGEILIYESTDQQALVEVKLEDETVWLTQKQMADLFQTTTQNVTVHLKNIFEEGELEELATCKDYLQVQTEGSRQVSRQVKFYNLDVIVSVGYRVNSKRGTQFRIWATHRLKDYLVRGYALDEKRLQLLSQSLNELEQTVKIIRQTGNTESLQLTEAQGLLDIIAHFSSSGFWKRTNTASKNPAN